MSRTQEWETLLIEFRVRNARNQFALAVQVAQDLLALCESESEVDPDSAAAFLSELGDLRRRLGEYDEADSNHKRALDILDKSGRTDTVTYATCISNLAGLRKDQHKYQEAGQLYTHALLLCEGQLGEDEAIIADVLNNLGVLYSAQSRFAEAAPLLERSRSLRERVHGCDNIHVAQTLANLAPVYRSQERLAEAEQISLRALDIFGRASGSFDLEIAHCLVEIAETWRQQRKRTGEAESYLKRAVGIQENLLGMDSPTVADTLCTLANLLYDRGTGIEAISLYERALSIYEKRFTRGHPYTETVRENLKNIRKGALHQDQNTIFEQPDHQ